VEGQSRILPGYPENLSEKARESLDHLGVTTLNNSMVQAVEPESVLIQESGQDSRRIPTRNVIWAAGNRSTGISEKLSKRTRIQLLKDGRIVVNPDLTVGDHSNLFVIGDLAATSDGSGGYLPGVAPVAMQAGKHAAQSILRCIEGKPSGSFHYRDMGSMAVIGRNAAVADFKWIGLSGFFAWILWVVIHIMNLVEYGNRLVVMLQWAWNYMTRKKGARLIGRSAERYFGRVSQKSDQLEKSA
jgi:NADH dehydrogenase